MKSSRNNSKGEISEEVDVDWDKSIIADAADYCSSTSFLQQLDTFKTEYSNIFENSVNNPEEQEHSLESTIAFNEYQKLIESSLEGYVISRNSSITEFCCDILDDKFMALFEEHEYKWFVEMILSWLDFDQFHIMMRKEIKSSARSNKTIDDRRNDRRNDDEDIGESKYNYK